MAVDDPERTLPAAAIAVGKSPPKICFPQLRDAVQTGGPVNVSCRFVVSQLSRAKKMSVEKRSFFDKALLIALDALGAVAFLITVGMLAFLVGSVGAFFGFAYAKQHDFPVSIQYGVAAVSAVLAPVWLCVWLWQRAIKSDDDTPQSN